MVNKIKRNWFGINAFINSFYHKKLIYYSWKKKEFGLINKMKTINTAHRWFFSYHKNNRNYDRLKQQVFWELILEFLSLWAKTEKIYWRKVFYKLKSSATAAMRILICICSIISKFLSIHSLDSSRLKM